MRLYGGALVSGSLCLLTKITQGNKLLLWASNEFGGYSGIGKKFSCLLHSTIAEKSNETIKPATVFQNSTKKLQTP